SGRPEIHATVGIDQTLAKIPAPDLGIIEWPLGVIGYRLRVIARNPLDELELTAGLDAVAPVLDLQSKGGSVVGRRRRGWDHPFGLDGQGRIEDHQRAARRRRAVEAARH